LRSKLVKKTKGKKMIWLFWATCPHTLTVVYFQGRPAHTLTLVYFHRRLAHTCSHWSIFMGDLSKHTQSGLFSGATGSHRSIFTGDLPTHAHTGLFSWVTCPRRKRKSGLIVMGDLPRWRNGLIVMSDLPR
jgi:hypothetical protein